MAYALITAVVSLLYALVVFAGDRLAVGFAITHNPLFPLVFTLFMFILLLTGVVFVITSLHLLHLNCTLLPVELRPSLGRRGRGRADQRGEDGRAAGAQQAPALDKTRQTRER